MSANADSVRFKFVRNVHVWAYSEKLLVSGKIYFLQKMTYVPWPGICCIKFLVVSDFEKLYSNDAKEADILNRSGLPLNRG